jgi:cephalosporin hydroxylase
MKNKEIYCEISEEYLSGMRDDITRIANDEAIKEKSLKWIREASNYKYIYHFSWLGRPVIQWPQDLIAMQELIWTINPDLIIETGIAHGGSLIFYASLLELNAICFGDSDAKVIGLDIDIRLHNRTAIEAHPLFKRIKMIEGDSIALDTIEQVSALAAGKQRIMVCLDSNHTHEHVLSELEAYAKLVTPGSYCVVFDTTIEDVPDDMFSDRPWGKGNNPKTAIHEYLRKHPEFVIDKSIENKLLITAALDGYLKRL